LNIYLSIDVNLHSRYQQSFLELLRLIKKKQFWLDQMVLLLLKLGES